jgi:hypothetical protein
MVTFFQIEKSGLSLRFPRVMGLREYKAARDATTVVELKRLKELQLNN